MPPFFVQSLSIELFNHTTADRLTSNSKKCNIWIKKGPKGYIDFADLVPKLNTMPDEFGSS